MIYILILVVAFDFGSGRSPAITTFEFAGKEKCMMAGKSVQESFKHPDRNFSISFVCVQK